MACRTPNPSADSDDVEKENEENYHPFWNFYCMRFVRTAFKAPPVYPKAIDMYQALEKAGMIIKDTSPAVGAIVFWHWSAYGHVGIYSGDGKVIHTGVNPSLKKNGVRESPLSDITEVLDRYNHYQKPQTSYLGWAYAPESWLKEF
jgi:cell wall-associated NlpC family hydrolase